MELSEAIEKCRVNDVFLCEGPRQPQRGSLALTGHHLIFSPSLPQNSEKMNSAVPVDVHEQELWLLHRVVDRVTVEPFSKNATVRQGAYLRLRCKNFMTCCFEMNELEDCQAVARSIEKLSNLSGFEHDYPFYYRCPFRPLDDGWTAFSVEEQFARLAICCPDRWRISHANKDFEVCASYPEAVIVPKGIGDDYLRIAATFRDGSRFPVLAYYHVDTKSYVVRCAQPLIGPTSRRCKEDETILNALLVNGGPSARGLIFDTRSKPTALASKGRGGGTETQLYYSRWKYVHGNVPRMRGIHDALTRLAELCATEGSSSSGFLYSSLHSSLSAAYANIGIGMSGSSSSTSSSSSTAERWTGRLATSGWLQIIADVLTGAATVAQCLHHEEISVVVHGAEGVDSTLLVTSLAQLCLDADARTVRGFEALIEREWIAAGHPFSLRCAHFAYATGALTGPHESPVFLCFLDCVWQIMHQYPCAFEFNEAFLIFLFEHAYASEFGSFLGTGEADKRRCDVKQYTVSLWSYVNHPDVLAEFVSAQYEPHSSTVWPSVAPQSIVLWERLYLRWQRSWADHDETQRMLAEWKRRERDLQTRMEQRQQRFEQEQRERGPQEQLRRHPPPIPPRLGEAEKLPLATGNSQFKNSNGNETTKKTTKVANGGEKSQADMLAELEDAIRDEVKIGFKMAGNSPFHD